MRSCCAHIRYTQNRSPQSIIIGLSRQVVFLGILGFLLSGCAWIVQPPQDDPQARALIEELDGRNPGLQNFKGMSHARFATQGRTLSGRIAWVAALPDRLRLEWLNPTGQPLTSVAADGRTLTVLNHHEQERYILRQSPDVLKDVIHVPIGIEDFLTLLAGRPLIPEYDAAEQRVEGPAFRSCSRIDGDNPWPSWRPTTGIGRYAKRFSMPREVLRFASNGSRGSRSRNM